MYLEACFQNLEVSVPVWNIADGRQAVSGRRLPAQGSLVWERPQKGAGTSV